MTKTKQPLVETPLLEGTNSLSVPCVDSLASSVPNTSEYEYARRRHNADIMLMSKLQLLSTRMVENDMDAKVEKDWQFTAKVFDRLMFFIFLLFYSGLNLYIVIFLYS